jgi:hypothetical protein
MLPGSPNFISWTNIGTVTSQSDAMVQTLNQKPTPNSSSA